MQIQENISLKRLNTFGIDAKTRYFSTFNNTDELQEILKSKIKNQKSKFILGGGSNILFLKDYDGLVLKNEIKGIELIHEDREYVFVKTGAGENWHQFVLHCIDHNWSGIENLSLIPGNVGAAPIQNIGAYGVELNEVFWDLEAFHAKENKIVTFTSADCEFGYRDSVFKRKYKDQFVILNLTLRLRKHPVFHTSYGAIQVELEKMGAKELSIKSISQAIINIRTSKLPDPAKIGNAGSFFKNPQIERQELNELQRIDANVPSFPVDKNHVKIPAAWLLEQCGPDKIVTSWKGFRRGDAGCHEKQPLVLVNYGNASGKEIYDLSEEIRKSVKKKFGIELDREVNVI